MTALFAIVIFLFINVLVYVMFCAVLAAVGWWMTHRADKAPDVETKLDRIKDKAFVLSVIVTFFFITPFVVLYLFIHP